MRIERWRLHLVALILNSIFHFHSVSLSIVPLITLLCVLSRSLPSITLAISLPKVRFYSSIRFLLAWIYLRSTGMDLSLLSLVLSKVVFRGVGNESELLFEVERTQSFVIVHFCLDAINWRFRVLPTLLTTNYYGLWCMSNQLILLSTSLLFS
ncbi:hypothetical protein VNO77_21607 [Canavalia gladiata]|uniref:Uncharacterized protein n=1 Tax=Canavalia gladiata TaxID=3824 RepID=A0AAN9LRE2_CANGL